MTVEEVLLRNKATIIMQKGSIKAAQSMLLPNEEVLWAITANVTPNPGRTVSQPNIKDLKGKVNGVIVITPLRILFVQRVLGIGMSKEIRLSDIRSLDIITGKMSAACLLIVGAANRLLVDGHIDTITQLSQAINSALASKNAPQTTSDDAIDASDVSQLQALKQLYDSGVITAEEFAAKKAQILNL